jgi:hypothetical protein
MIDKKQFADHFMLTCLAYDKEFNPELAKLYFADLQEFQDSQVVSAFNQHRKDPDRGRFFPKVADIVYQIQKQSAPIDSASTIELEWSKVIKAVSRGVKPSNCTQETLGALQMVGGVQVVGYADAIELSRIKKAFADSYNALSNCRADEVPEHLHNAVELKQSKMAVIKRD